MTPEQIYSVSDFQAVCNQIMETAFSGVTIEGEIASFKINQGKFVFFDLKDDQSSVGCFMMKFALRFPLEDGMRVRIRAVPKLTNWGKFSLTVQAVMPIGEGSLKKSFELLKKKLTAEGLFAIEKKRPLPQNIIKIGVISSTQAAGYADFCKIVNERWGGLKISVAHTQVQGMAAADQIIKALKYFNEHNEVQVIAIIRGGGSADDLAVFNDETLVRAVAASRIPIITGIGHEIDESLCDLAADVVASTPSNAAQMLTRDRRAIIAENRESLARVKNVFISKIDTLAELNITEMKRISRDVVVKITTEIERIQQWQKVLDQLNPDMVLRRGYSIIRGEAKIGSVIEIETAQSIIAATIKDMKGKI